MIKMKRNLKKELDELEKDILKLEVQMNRAFDPDDKIRFIGLNKKKKKDLT